MPVPTVNPAVRSGKKRNFSGHTSMYMADPKAGLTIQDAALSCGNQRQIEPFRQLVARAST